MKRGGLWRRRIGGLAIGLAAGLAALLLSQAGALGSLATLPAALALGVFLAVIAATRYISLASVTAVASFPLWLHLCGRAGWTPAPPGWLTASAVALAILIAVKHHDNFARLAAGCEHRLGQSRQGSGSA